MIQITNQYRYLPQVLVIGVIGENRPVMFQENHQPAPRIACAHQDLARLRRSGDSPNASWRRGYRPGDPKDHARSTYEMKGKSREIIWKHGIFMEYSWNLWDMNGKSSGWILDNDWLQSMLRIKHEMVHSWCELMHICIYIYIYILKGTTQCRHITLWKAWDILCWYSVPICFRSFFHCVFEGGITPQSTNLAIRWTTILWRNPFFLPIVGVLCSCRFLANEKTYGVGSKSCEHENSS